MVKKSVRNIQRVTNGNDISLPNLTGKTVLRK